MEAELEAGEDAEKCFDELRNFVDILHMKNNPQYYQDINRDNVSQSESIDKTDAFITVINLSDTKQKLERFKLQVERENNPKLTEAYNNKLKTFQ